MSQSETRVVNSRKEAYDVYIGRRVGNSNYGNPFSHHNSSTLASIRTPTREVAVAAFKEWLEGSRWADIEPERRLWILAHIKDLKGKRLGCFCKPLECHGDVLKELADACD